MYIQIPLTCKRTSWIYQCSYGRSLYHGDLVELGEATSIITGRPIGESGTQLALRILNTSGVWTSVLPSIYKLLLMENLLLIIIWFIKYMDHFWPITKTIGWLKSIINVCCKPKFKFWSTIYKFNHLKISFSFHQPFSIESNIEQFLVD